jgi:hypothetical protein
MADDVVSLSGSSSSSSKQSHRSKVSSAHYSVGAAGGSGGAGCSSSANNAETRRLALRILEKITTVYTILAHDVDIVSKQHAKAAKLMDDIQRLLSEATDVDKSCQIRLICVCTSLLRRISRMREEENRLSQEISDAGEGSAFGETIETLRELRIDLIDFSQTLNLTFITIAIADVAARGGVAVDTRTAKRELEDMLARSLWMELSKTSSKRKLEVPENVDELEKQRLKIEDMANRPFLTREESSSWEHVLYNPGAIAGAALRVAGSMLTTATLDDIPRFEELALVFARNTVMQMQLQLLKSVNDPHDSDFLTLSNTSLLDAVNTQRHDQILEGIVSAGESEAGQAVLRDIVQSFLVPREVIGVRRALLLSRDASERISKDFPWIAGLAHEVAMAGCETIWASSTSSELKRMCALLTGLAMLTTNGVGDTLLRRSAAFNGLIQLPFLEVPPPSPTAHFLALVPTSRSWCVYTLRGGRPEVEISKRGFDGLCMCILNFRKTVKS